MNERTFHIPWLTWQEYFPMPMWSSWPQPVSVAFVQIIFERHCLAFTFTAASVELIICGILCNIRVGWMRRGGRHHELTSRAKALSTFYLDISPGPSPFSVSEKVLGRFYDSDAYLYWKFSISWQEISSWKEDMEDGRFYMSPYLLVTRFLQRTQLSLF